MAPAPRRGGQDVALAVGNRRVAARPRRAQRLKARAAGARRNRTGKEEHSTNATVVVYNHCMPQWLSSRAACGGQDADVLVEVLSGVVLCCREPVGGTAQSP